MIRTWFLATALLTLGIEVALAQPANDNCGDATPIGEGSFAFDNTGATLDGPFDCEMAADADIWYRYTASATGTATIETCGSSGISDTALIVYSGDACPVPGDEVLACDDDNCGLMSLLQLPVVAGTTYFVQVSGWGGAEGSGTLEITLGPDEDCTDGIDNDGDGDTDCDDSTCYGAPGCAPINDDCADALTLTEGVPEPFNLLGATDFQDLGYCFIRDDIWYEFTPSTTGFYSVDLTDLVPVVGTGSQVAHSIYLNPGGGACPTNNDQIACQTALQVTTDAQLTTGMFAGQSYLIRVGMRFSGISVFAAGNLTINTAVGEFPDCANGIDDDGDGTIDCLDLDCFNHPDCAVLNDDCADALPIGLGVYDISNLGATLDGPRDCEYETGADVWFRFTSSFTGSVSVRTCATSSLGPEAIRESILVVYEDSGCPSGFDPFLACDDDACGPQHAAVDFDAVDQQSYLIQVAGWRGERGHMVLEIEGDGDPEICGDGVDNDLDGLTDCADGDCFGAPDCGEICGDGINNDADGLVDCDDSECFDDPGCGVLFRRGDVNQDGGLDVGDPVFVASYLFEAGATPACLDAGDVNSDGVLDIADVIFPLTFLFSGGPPPEAPFPACGIAAITLGCDSFNCP